MVFANAQQKDYKTFLETLFQHSENDFKDIAGQENENSIFRDSKLKPEVGDIKISLMCYGTNLNWTIPLDKFSEIQKDAADFIKTKFSEQKDYVIAKSDDLENENFVTINVYQKIDDRKPKLIFQTFYDKDNDNVQKSNFTIVFYGK